MTVQTAYPWRDPWRAALYAALAAALLWTIRPMWSVDIGFHLRTGEWMVEKRELPGAGVFMAGGETGRYVDPSWLYQAGVYLAHRAGGETLFGAVHALAWAAAMAMLWLRCSRRETPAWAGIAFFAAGACVVEGRIAGRPESVALALLGAMLAALDAWRSGDRRWLWVLPVAQALWVNVHGTFVFGWAAMAAYGAGAALRGGPADFGYWRWVGGAVAATFLTPYGLAGVLLPFELAARFGAEPVFRENIPELWTPWRASPDHAGLLMGHTLGAAYYGLAVAGPLLMLIGRRAMLAEDWLLAGIFSAVAAGSVRMTPFFAVACVPVFARAAGAAFGGREAPRLLGWAAAALAAAQCARIATGADYGYRVIPSRFAFGIEKAMSAATATGFLLEHGREARVLPDAQLGSWLVWALKRPSEFHGNMEILGAARFREYLESQREGGLAPLLERRAPDLVALEVATSAGWFAQLVRMEGWRMVYADEAAAVFARAGFAPELPASGYGDFVARTGRHSRDQPSRWKAIFKSPEGWPERFFRPRPFRFDLAAADVAMYLGEREAAEAIYLDALASRACNDNEAAVFKALGIIYDATRDAPKAIACYARALRAEPADEGVRRALEAIAEGEARRAGR